MLSDVCVWFDIMAHMSVPCHEGPPATKGHFSSEPAVAGRGRYYCSRNKYFYEWRKLQSGQSWVWQTKVCKYLKTNTKRRLKYCNFSLWICLPWLPSAYYFFRPDISPSAKPRVNNISFSTLYNTRRVPFNGPLSGTKYPTRAASPIQNASTPKSSLPFSKHRSCALLCTVVRRF